MLDMEAKKKEFVKNVTVCISCQAQPFVYGKTESFPYETSNGKELVSVLIYSSMPRSSAKITMCILPLMK